MERRMVTDQEIARYLSDVTGTVRQLLGENFVGSYLHGSLTMAAFQPTKSDIDVIVTVDWPLNDTMRDVLRNRVGSVPLPAAASGLDLSLLSTDVARQLTENSRWEVTIQVSRTWSGQDARERERADPFLFVDVALLRQHGIALAGPSIEESFGPVAPRLILKASAENCRIWADRDVFNDPASGILNVCRAWRYLEEGSLVSKPEAGEWARSKLEDSALVDAALAKRRGDTSQSLSDAEVKGFCQRIFRFFEVRGLP